MQSKFDCTFLFCGHPRLRLGILHAPLCALARRVAAAGAKRPCPRSLSLGRSLRSLFPCARSCVLAGLAGWVVARCRSRGGGSPTGRRLRRSLGSLAWSIVRCRRRRGASLPPQSPCCGVASHPRLFASAPSSPSGLDSYAVRARVGLSAA